MEILLINIDEFAKSDQCNNPEFKKHIEEYQFKNIVVGFSNENRAGVQAKIDQCKFQYDYVILAYGTIILNKDLALIDQDFHNYELVRKMYENEKKFSFWLIDQEISVNGWSKRRATRLKGNIDELEPLTIFFDTDDLDQYSEFSDEFTLVPNEKGKEKIMIPKNTSVTNSVKKILEIYPNFERLNSLILTEGDLQIYDILDFTFDLTTYSYNSISEKIKSQVDFTCDTTKEIFELMRL